MILSDARCLLIGMVHLAPLPGSPSFEGSVDAIVERAVRDARALLDSGCDGLIVENMHDAPYLRGRVEPETTAAAAIAAREVVRSAGTTPVGVQLLAGANREALGVAVAAGARFVRVEAFAYAHVADEGWLDACAGELLRARRALGASIEVWADVRKKHAAHAVTADLSLEELARGAAFSGADAVVVTGKRTGAATALEDVRAARAAGLPVAVGSGVTPADVASLSSEARALIVGTWLKEDGDVRKPVDPARVRALKQAMR